MNNYSIRYQISTIIEGKAISVFSYISFYATNEYEAAYLLGRESKGILFKNHIFDVIMSNDNLKEFMIIHDCYPSSIIDFHLEIIDIEKN